MCLKPHKKDNSSHLGEALQEVDIDNRVHRKDQGAFLDTQIQPITGSCMEARPKGHPARVLKVVRENKVSWKIERCKK